MGGMPAFPKNPDHATRAILGAIEALRSAGRTVTAEAICELTGRERRPTSSVIARLRRIGRLPCRIERSPSRGRAYLRVVAAAEQLEREGGALSWDRIARVVGCSARAASNHATKAKLAGLWRWTVLSKYSLMTAEERSELWRSTRSNRDCRGGWASEAEHVRMDMDEASRIKAEWSATMIDGRGERDDTPPGIAAVSGKDHGRWSEMSRRFENPAGAIGGEARVHKYHSPHARHYT